MGNTVCTWPMGTDCKVCKGPVVPGLEQHIAELLRSWLKGGEAQPDTRQQTAVPAHAGGGNGSTTQRVFTVF